MWKRIRSWFAWRDVRDSGVWLYQQNAVTGARRAVRISTVWQPLDGDWLEGQPDLNEIANRKLTRTEAEGICDTPELCFVNGSIDWVRCGPCSLSRHYRRHYRGRE